LTRVYAQKFTGFPQSGELWQIVARRIQTHREKMTERGNFSTSTTKRDRARFSTAKITVFSHVLHRFIDKWRDVVRRGETWQAVETRLTTV
jgi:hypothetical protein